MNKRDHTEAKVSSQLHSIKAERVTLRTIIGRVSSFTFCSSQLNNSLVP